jgi:hypothetical protein
MRYRVERKQAGQPGRCKQCDIILRVPKTIADYDSETTVDIMTITVDARLDGPWSFFRRTFGI